MALNTKERMQLNNLIANLSLASADCRTNRRKTIHKQKKEHTPYTEEQKQYCREYYQKNKKKKQTQANMFYEANRERVLEQKKKQYAEDESLREKQKAYGKEYRKDKKEHYYQMTVDWRAKNREKYNAYMREYRKKQKEAKCLQ